MSRAIADPQVREYLEAVRARLGDLDAEAREHLLSDTEASLLEATDDGVTLPPEVRLGPPERFASELRAAAGLPEEPAAPARRPGPWARLKAHPRAVAARGLAHELAPVWWVVRAYAGLTLLAQLLGDDWSARYPIFTGVLGSPLGWLLLAGAIAASVALGRRERRPARRRAKLLNVALGIATAWAALVFIAHAGQWSPDVVYVQSAPEHGVVFDGWHVANIYPYDRHGRLLQDVRLYDQHGRPMAIRDGQRRRRRVPRDGSGARVLNSFPIRYFARGSHRVRHPAAGVLDRRPAAIVTPPVRTGRR
jgi:hypothetical protein